MYIYTHTHLFPLYTLKHQTPSYNVPLNTAHPVTICPFTHTQTQPRNIMPIHTYYKAKASLPCIMWTLTVQLTIQNTPIQRMCPLTNYNSNSHAAWQTCPSTNCTAYYTFTKHNWHPWTKNTQSQCTHSQNIQSQHSHSLNPANHNAPIHTTLSVTTHPFGQHTHSQCTLTQHIHSPLVHPFTGEVHHIAQVENPCTFTLWTNWLWQVHVQQLIHVHYQHNHKT